MQRVSRKERIDTLCHHFSERQVPYGSAEERIGTLKLQTRLDVAEEEDHHFVQCSREGSDGRDEDGGVSEAVNIRYR